MSRARERARRPVDEVEEPGGGAPGDVGPSGVSSVVRRPALGREHRIASLLREPPCLVRPLACEVQREERVEGHHAQSPLVYVELRDIEAVPALDAGNCRNVREDGQRTTAMAKASIVLSRVGPIGNRTQAL